MKYQCQNESCKKLFIYPAKKTSTTLSMTVQMSIPEESTSTNIGINPKTTTQTDMIETHGCPYCGCIDIEEYTPPIEPEKQPENVLVIDLTSGPQIAIDKALADGYHIVNRYAKQYVMEK